jgi:hypothetical protein
MSKRLLIGMSALLLAGLVTGGVVLIRNSNTRVDVGVGGGGKALTPTDLKYVLMERFGPLHYCDPDSFPVAQEGGEERGARAWWATVDKTGEEVTTIRRHLGLVGGELTESSVLLVYRDHKRLQVIPLQADGGEFRFAVRTDVAGKSEEIATAGVIKSDGRIKISNQKREGSVGCPICLSGATLIDTPDGPVRLADLREGMPVWTADASGTRVAATVLRTARRAVAVGHPMIRITLADGRFVAASPGHPTRAGRAFASLNPGARLDGARIVAIDVLASNEPYTYDLLPSGPTGAYWADGVLIGSTLAVNFAE